jgi:D-arabinose 1-dehydrogenase-like Zn-dependent alcohol dehydrogenase
MPVGVCEADQISETLDRLKAGNVIGRMVARMP